MAVSLDKFHIWENAHAQSDCRIFKSIISLEQNYEKDWFLHADTDSLIGFD